MGKDKPGGEGEYLEGDEQRDPHIVEYRELLARQNLELKAQLQKAKAEHVTPGGRWMRRRVVFAVAGLALVAGTVFWWVFTDQSKYYREGAEQGAAAARMKD